jgi:exodeoxyribonuclease V gamma subunit
MVPGRDPLAPDVVVVQGPGMERWIAQSIAREYGVCANTAFPFPRDFIESVFSAIPEESLARPNSGWDVQNLTWRIAKRLGEARDDPDFEPLARQLHAVDGDWRLIQLSHRIANLLDHYIIFRPEWISAWTSAPALPTGRDERWQARLFREVAGELGGGHVAERALAFQECVRSRDRRAVEERLRSKFSGAIEIFAVSTLPPLYLSVINGLGQLCDVHLSVLSPSRHYWADLWREVKDDQPIAPRPDGSRSVFDVSRSAPMAALLAGLGRLGSDFQLNLEQQPEIQEGEADLFEAPCVPGESPSLLARFQTRLLELDDSREEATEEAGEAALDRIVMREDDSIRVHVCHGARRELEVVEAVLRDAFERDETLLPEDVIVMAPRIDEIAPDIEAVFGVSTHDPGGIPYRIADRGVFRRSPVAEAFRGLLDLIGGRAGRSEVLDWLAREPVRTRFGLDESGVEQIAEWAERAGIRFGLDEAHRETLGLSRERAHTWSGGLDRLALAHAVGARDDVFAGLSATPLGPMGDPELLGAVGDVESILSGAIRAIGKPRSVADWCSWLQSILERTLAQSDSNAHEHATIRGILVDMAKSSKHSGFEQPIPYEAIRERVSDAIESTPAPQPFLSGGVTFCELVPLRAIPFRVIAILGMCDAAFPRGGPAPGFDLMAQDPRSGDRTTRNDDRYLFLEALLSARDQLIITLPGHDVRDGSTLPASVVVSDFVEALDSLFELEADANQRRSLIEWLVVSHPLQASSPRYFETPGDSRLIGRDEEAYSGALARRAAIDAGGGTARRFLSEARTESATGSATDSDRPTLSLDDLAGRILRSTRFFSRGELQLRLPRPEAATDDLDPTDLDPLLQYGLGSALLEHFRAGATAKGAVKEATKEATRRLIANAAVPAGTVGRLSANALQAEVEEVARVGHARCAGDRLDDLDFALDLDAVAGLGRCRLVGRLDQLWPGGRIELGFSRIGRRAELDLWIRHLVLCSLVDGGADFVAQSVFVGRPESKSSDDRVVVFERVSDSQTHLARLFEWAWSAAEAPLPFFPNTGWAFAAKAIAGKSDQAWRDAHQKYEGGESHQFSLPESEEELEYARIWEGWSPLDSAGKLPVRYRFEDLTTQFFEPLLEAREVYRE